MKRFLFLIAFVAASASARELELGLRHLIVTTGSSDGLDVPMSRGFAGTAELYFTPRVSAELSAGFVNPEAILDDAIDLGTIGLQTTALTARWNFAPESRLSAFAGAGAALVRIGNLDDQFGDAIEADFDSELALVVEGGLRFRLRRAPRLAGVLTVSYMPLTAEPRVRKSNVALPDELALNPLTVGVGASWRF